MFFLSGGIDSSTTLSIVKKEGFELYALTFDYMWHELTILVAHIKQPRLTASIDQAGGCPILMIISRIDVQPFIREMHLKELLNLSINLCKVYFGLIRKAL